MSAGSKRLSDLLEYVAQLEQLRTKPASAIPAESLALHQSVLTRMPGIRLNASAENPEPWLQMERLQPALPPEPDVRLSAFIDRESNPATPPVLRRGIAQSEIQTLFEQYLATRWRLWADTEHPRNRAIALYEELFALQQAMAADGAEAAVELVWGIGYAVWKKPGMDHALRHPLITQACDLLVDEHTLMLSVRPREVDPVLELDGYREMELPGLPALEAAWNALLATGACRVSPFEPMTFDGVLKSAAMRLDPAGVYDRRSTDLTLPEPGERLLVTNLWTLFARRRKDHLRARDIARLRTRLAAVKTVPDVLLKLVENGSPVLDAPAAMVPGDRMLDDAQEVCVAALPLPCSEEQLGVLRKLESYDGVLVQGGPGSGKTHTIANVVAHFLAQGRRVLVTASTESALAALQEKLPEPIRPLSVALLSDEQDRVRRLEHSVQAIASGIDALKPARARTEMAAAQERMKRLEARIGELDRMIAGDAGKHLRRYPFNGRQASAEELARHVLANTPAFGWLDDDITTAKAAAGFGEAEIARLRRARIDAGADLRFHDQVLPTVETLPDTGALCGLHQDLVRLRRIDADIVQGGVMPLIDSSAQTLERARMLALLLDARNGLHARLQASDLEWTGALAERLSLLPAASPLLETLRELCATIEALDEARFDLLSKAVSAPEAAECDADLLEAIGRLATGKSAVVLPLGKRGFVLPLGRDGFTLPFGKAASRALLARIRLAGVVPSKAEDWACVDEHLRWLIEVRKAIARWNALSAELGLPPLREPAMAPAAEVASDTGTQADAAAVPGMASPGEGIWASFKSLNAWRRTVEDVQALRLHDLQLRERSETVFGRHAQLDAVGESLFAALARSLDAHLERERLAAAAPRVAAMLKPLQGCSDELAAPLRTLLLAEVGNAAIGTAALRASWTRLIAHLRQLAALRPAFAEIVAITTLIERAGGVRWAARLRSKPVPADPGSSSDSGSDGDPLTPEHWAEAWNWRLAATFLSRIDGHEKLVKLLDERRSLAAERVGAGQQLLAHQCWLGLHDHLPGEMRQALQAYLCMMQIPAKGADAIRHRAGARKAMTLASQAVPCWIMPHWRIAETVPADIGLFDLVVIDEASQTDIGALPALLRGRKLLIVGDQRPMPPPTADVSEDRLGRLAKRFLDAQPHGAQMTPGRSLHQLARTVFADSALLLTQDFRESPAAAQPTARSQRECCKTRLEGELFDWLSARGYRVSAQPTFGAYRIDLMVEGRDGRRLAIECDGDSPQGPERWSQDMARQQALERAGWIFWRCFASSFILRREAVLADLSRRLKKLGIEPAVQALRA